MSFDSMQAKCKTSIDSATGSRYFSPHSTCTLYALLKQGLLSELSSSMLLAFTKFAWRLLLLAPPSPGDVVFIRSCLVYTQQSGKYCVLVWLEGKRNNLTTQRARCDARYSCRAKVRLTMCLKEFAAVQSHAAAVS